MSDILKVWDSVNEQWVGIPAIKGDRGGLTGNASTALLTLLQHVAYADENGQTYYNNLVSALETAEIDSISAVFTQGSNVVFNTDSLDVLRQYLVVTAHWADNTDEVIASGNYTLSGTLTAGTSTITVSFLGKTATFTATVTTAPVDQLPDKVTAGSTYRVTTTHYGHVKVEILSAMTTTNNGWAINLRTGVMGAVGSAGIYQQGTRFTIPAGDVTASGTNISNANSVKFGALLGIATNTNSALWFDNTTAPTTSYTDTKTLESNTAIGAVGLYINQQSLSLGTVIEFDLSISNTTTRFV